VKLVSTGWTSQTQFGVIDAGKVEGTCGLHLAHVEAEGPCEGGEILENVIGEIGAVHLWDYCVVVHVRGLFKEGDTVNVEGRLIECEFRVPVISCGLT